MKTISLKRMAAALMAAACIGCPVWASDKDDKASTDKADRHSVKVLVIGLPDNVDSNYFPNSMITEETGMPVDSIDHIYNQVITQNIIAANKNTGYRFLECDTPAEVEGLMDGVEWQGESEEEQYANLSRVDKESYNHLMEDEDADYILLLNRHYLKWQEKPLRTLFHITTYSLYDKNKNEVARGNNYFTSMELEGKDKLSKDSRKSSSKIASNVIKCLSKQ